MQRAARRIRSSYVNHDQNTYFATEAVFVIVQVLFWEVMAFTSRNAQWDVGIVLDEALLVVVILSRLGTHWCRDAAADIRSLHVRRASKQRMHGEPRENGLHRSGATPKATFAKKIFFIIRNQGI